MTVERLVMQRHLCTSFESGVMRERVQGRSGFSFMKRDLSIQDLISNRPRLIIRCKEGQPLRLYENGTLMY